ncbi:cell division protein SepF [Oceanobacillus halotolerans]|uniref:cell division protein SepF n=1 Tax=Oceanobacillus halotolerans TaxID=2663380 RepID=UPI0013DBCA3F|nr:cell division protein SepF [Oceanobacillus halotolerans]
MSIKNKIKDFFTMDDEYEYVEEEVKEKNEVTEQTNKVVNLKAIQQSSSKVVLSEPRTYNEVQEIADHIINRRAVVINLQRVDHYQAKKMLDFLSGTVYALNGDIKKLGTETFLCTPENVDVSGSISEVLVEYDDYEKGWYKA